MKKIMNLKAIFVILCLISIIVFSSFSSAVQSVESNYLTDEKFHEMFGLSYDQERYLREHGFSNDEIENMDQIIFEDIRLDLPLTGQEKGHAYMFFQNYMA